SVTAPIADLSAYVFRALRNRIIDEYRRARPDMISMEGEQDGEDLYEILPDTKYEPRGSMERRMLRREIFEAIRSLPAEQRQVVVETELNGMSMAELARRTSTPLGTIFSRTHWGIRNIRKRLEHLKEE
ncbi:MAG: RNA polymerase sigma factor, partial [Candidatus Fermentibacterota bacterium]